MSRKRQINGNIYPKINLKNCYVTFKSRHCSQWYGRAISELSSTVASFEGLLLLLKLVLVLVFLDESEIPSGGAIPAALLRLVPPRWWWLLREQFCREAVIVAIFGPVIIRSKIPKISKQIIIFFYIYMWLYLLQENLIWGILMIINK